MTVAPASIEQLNTTLEARSDRPSSYAFLGIVGDATHSFGYHLSKNQLLANGKPGDYSLQLPRDAAGGSKFPDDASAWDLGFDPADMIAVTTRLIAAAKSRDPRLVNVVREFCGTTNGTSPHPYDVASNFDDPNNTEGWDQSHVTHVHLSFYRDTSNDYAAMQGVLDVICGKPATPPPSNTEDDDMLIVFTLTVDKTGKAIPPASQQKLFFAPGWFVALPTTNPAVNALSAVAKNGGNVNQATADALRAAALA